MKPVNTEELRTRIRDWINERQDSWTDQEAIQMRTLRKQRVSFLLYGSLLSDTNAYYMFEQIKQTYLDNIPGRF